MRRTQNFSLVSRYAALGCALLTSALTFTPVPQPATLTLVAAFALLSLLGLYDMVQAKHALRPCRFSYGRTGLSSAKAFPARTLEHAKAQARSRQEVA